MTIILRAILALIVDLLVCYLCGEFILHNFYKKIYHTFTCILVGFLICQSIFEVITLCCYFMGEGLEAVTWVWMVVVCLICLLGAGTCARKGFWNRQTADNIRSSHILPILGAFLTVAAFCYYVSINGETNADSRYYISLVNTTLNTGTLFQYNPYNGVYGNSWYLRRALATYEIHSAMLCRVFGIPALVVTRITRACQNVILTSMTVYLLGQRVLWRDNTSDKKLAKSSYLVVLFLLLQLVYAETYPSGATFFLFRAYEGKALSANLLVLLTMYLCAEVMLGKQKRNLLLLAAVLWGAIAISSSGMVVIGIEIAIFMSAYVMKLLIERLKGRKHVRS